MGNKLKTILEYVIICFVAILAGKLISTNVMYRANIDGLSMYPSYDDGEKCYVLVHGKVSRGDVVIVDIGDKYIVKRVIGLPGDIIKVFDSKVYINGALYTEDYIYDADYDGGILSSETEIGVNQYAVLGDNRPISNDSRALGLISGSSIRGVVVNSNKLGVFE